MSHLTCVPATDPAATHRTTAPSAIAPSTSDPRPTVAHPAARPHLVLVAGADPHPDDTDEDGSLVAEYGLLAVVAATVAGVLISWAGSGALASFFGQLLNHARSLVVS